LFGVRLSIVDWTCNVGAAITGDEEVTGIVCAFAPAVVNAGGLYFFAQEVQTSNQ
jgi:hypothetical protein